MVFDMLIPWKRFLPVPIALSFAPQKDEIQLTVSGKDKNRKFMLDLIKTERLQWGDVVYAGMKREIPAGKKWEFKFYSQDLLTGKISVHSNPQDWRIPRSGGSKKVTLNLPDDKLNPPRTSYAGIGETVPERLNLLFSPKDLREKKEFLDKYKLEPQLLSGRYIAVRLPTGTDRDELQKKLAQEGMVTSVEPDRVLKMCESQDLRQTQWNMRQFGDIRRLGEINSTKEVIVAILDTGIDRYHEDLDRNNILPGYDFLNLDDDPADDNGHGTEMAGIMAALWNEYGIDGMFPRMKILPVKVLDNQGYGCYSILCMGIYYAIDHGASIINISAAGHGYSEMMKKAILYALDKGCTIIAAAGNEGNKEPLFPASYNYVISVAANGPDGNIWASSNINAAVDFWAPGVDIPTLLPGSKYGSTTGTSAAAAHVSGLAAAISLTQNSSKYEQVLAGLKILRDGQKILHLPGVPTQVTPITDEIWDTTESKIGFTYEEDALFEACHHMYPEKQVHQYLSGQAFENLWNNPDADKGLVKEFGKYIGKETDVNYTVTYEVEEYQEQGPPIIVENTFKYIKIPTYTGGEVGQDVPDFTPTPTPYSFVDWPEFIKNTDKGKNTALAGNNDVIEGSMEEDMYYWPGGPFAYGPKHALPIPDFNESTLKVVGCHFWDPITRHGGNFDVGLNGVWPTGNFVFSYKSSIDRAEELWEKMLAVYKDDPKQAYYLLGRVAHLLQDMTLPAHVLNDWHNSYLIGLGPDPYEDFVGEPENYRIYSELHDNNIDITQYRKVPNQYNWCYSEETWNKQTDLFKLFYSVTEITDDDSSKDVWGDMPAPGNFTYDEYNLYLGKKLLPLAVRATAELYKLFWKEIHHTVSVIIKPDELQNQTTQKDMWRIKPFTSEVEGKWLLADQR